MKGKRIKRLFAMALAAGMLLTGCGNSGVEGPESSVEEGADGTVTENGEQELKELTVFIDFDWFWMDDFGGRPVDDAMMEQSGVKLNIIKATDSQQLPIMIASGDLPDIIYTSNFADLNNGDVCWEMGELLSTYTPDFNPPAEQIASAMNDEGKYYYLVNFWQNEDDWEDPHYLPGVGNSGFIYRQDILEELGNPSFETMDDLMNVLEMVKENYPDMVPIALGPEGSKYNIMINQSVVQSGVTDVVQQDDGSWKFMANTKEYQEGMQMLFEMAQKGYLDPNMFTLKYDQYIAEAQQGNIFMWLDDASNAALYNSALEASGVENASTLMKKGSFFENPAPSIDTASGWAGTFVTKNCKDPETAAKFLQWASTDEAGKLVGWGVEGLHYTEDENGYPVLTPEIAESWNKDYDATVKETGIGAWFFGTRGWYESVRTYDPDSNPELTEWLLAFKDTVKIRPECANLRPEAGTDIEATYVKLQELVSSYYPQLIFANDQDEFDKLYNELMSQIELQGGNEYEAWANEKWASIQESLGE